MYVAKIYRRGVVVSATIFEKNWSEDLSSNVITILGSKKFISKRRANQWVNNKVCNHLSSNKRLEILNEQ